MNQRNLLKYKHVTELESGKFSACASSIGLRPGAWPDRIETVMGNGLAFVRSGQSIDADGDLVSVKYEQVAGCITLTVFND